MTVGTVVDGKLDNERLGALSRRQNELVRRINEGTLPFEGVMDALQSIIEGCFWPVWKTIKLGTGIKDADDFRKAFKNANCDIDSWANDILGQPAFKVSKIETEADLVNISVAELGFKEGARYADICKSANEFGLDLCPAEVGPQLRLQYKDQPNGEGLFVAMEAIANSNGYLCVFCVKRIDDGGQWLNVYSGSGCPDCFWYANDRFVFRRRK